MSAKRISAQLENLGSPPKVPQSDTHIWVDYIELLCLYNRDHELSKADIIDHFRKCSDLGEGLEEMETEEDCPFTAEEEPALGEEAETPIEEEELSSAEENDKLGRRVDDLFRHIEFRKGEFGSFYPFSLTSEGDALIFESEQSLEQKFYIFLLLSSSLKYIRPQTTYLTSNFEFLSCEAMKKILPSNAEVHIFGANPIHKSKYTGNIWKRINMLAIDLREKVFISESEYPPTDTGDSGLDVVGWVPFEDSASGLPVFFAQCGCTTKWVEKQHSSSYERWGQIMHFAHRPGNLAFIPFCFRNADGGWFRERVHYFSIIVDRLRLVKLLKGQLKIFESLDSRHIVEEILQHQ